MENGNIDRVYRQLERIENKLDKMADDHGDRLSALELHKAENTGAQKVTSSFWGAASGLGAAVVALILQSFLGPRY